MRDTPRLNYARCRLASPLMSGMSPAPSRSLSRPLGRASPSPRKPQVGPIVTITSVALSERWQPRSGSLSSLIPYHYPDAAIYPFYVIGATRPAG